MNRSPLTGRTVGVLALIISLVLAGCAASAPSPSASPVISALPSTTAEPSQPASEPASAEPSATATALPSEEPTKSLPPFKCVPSVTIARTTDRAQITDVRVGTHESYDRVAIQFSGGLPQTVIEGVLPPFFADASGLPLDVAGTAFLKVTMNDATKVSPDGGVTYAGARNFEPGFARIVQLIEGGDSEAVSTWYIGLDGGGCYRVLALTSPSRLVIDIEH